MALFLVDGRDSDCETVRVTDAEFVTVKTERAVYDGVTTELTEHNLTVFLDDSSGLTLGSYADVTVGNAEVSVDVKGVVTGTKQSANGSFVTHTIEILDFGGAETEYWQILYDRIPTLPQSLHRDYGVVMHLWQNIAHRLARSGK